MIKKATLFSLLIIICQSAFAQLSLDSLKRVWYNTSLPHTIRFEAMTDLLVHGKIYSYFDSLHYYSDLEIREARALGLDKYLADGLVWRSGDYFAKSELSLSLTYIDSAEQIYQRLNDKYGEYTCLSSKGMYLFFSDQRDEGLLMVENAFEKMKVLNNSKGLYSCAQNLVTLYSITGDFAKRMQYANLCLQLAEEQGVWLSMAEAYHHMADLYYVLDITDEGDYYHEKALEYSRKSGYIYEEMNIIGHIAAIAMKNGEYEKSLTYLAQVRTWNEKYADEQGNMSDRAREIYVLVHANRFNEAKERIDNFRMSFDNEVLLSKLYMGYIDLSEGTMNSKLGNPKRGAELCLKAYNTFLGFNQYHRELEACECMYEAYKAMGDHEKALEYHELQQKIEDTIHKEDAVKELQRIEFHKQQIADSLAVVEEARLVQLAHEEEMRKEEKTRNIGFGVGVLVLLLAGGLYSRLRYVRKSKAIIETERDRSDNLLLNILPEEIAQELKEKGKADARDFEMVSILFTDFKGFTQQSAKLSAAELVNEINHCFEAFDSIMEKYGIEKIKTIGDAYMAAGGLPVPTNDSVKNTVLAALEMQDFIIRRKVAKDAKGEPAFEMRVGIHTGPVVAGIVGVKKFQYDIWGDTVNTASRMESAGEAGKVNISQATYELLNSDSDFSFESRGKIEAKGKGEMEMYFVNVNK